MKTKPVPTSAIIALTAIAACIAPAAPADVMEADQYYTWGLDGKDLDIPEGSIITEAVLNIHNITNWDHNLHIHLIDNPPLGIVAQTDNSAGDFFHDAGGLMTDRQYELVNGDLLITFSTVNDPNSWVWDIFDSPFHFQLADSSTVSYSSLLLELIDCAGNNTPFGLSFDPEGADCGFDSISLELLIESFEGAPAQSSLTFSTTGPLQLIAHWALDDNTDTVTVQDSVGGHHGAGSVNTSILHASGKVGGGSFDFNGDRNITVADHDDFTFGTGTSDTPFSITGWVYVDGNVSEYIISKDDKGIAREWGLQIDSGGRLRFDICDAGSDQWQFATTNSAIAQGWRFVAVTYDGRGKSNAAYGITLYVDDAVSASTAHTHRGANYAAMENTDTDLLIGARKTLGETGYIFRAQIDNITLYGRTLSADEISRLYAEQSG